MKVTAVIPARYASSRFPGKPLVDMCGRPMIWWVYEQVKKARKISAIVVATDDQRIKDCCEQFQIPVIMTSPNHGTSTERLNEVAGYFESDGYVCVNGDEPLIDPSHIDAVIPAVMPDSSRPYVANIMAEISDPVELLDPTNIKVVVAKDGDAMFFSRSPIPYPKASITYKYHKHLGVLFYNKEALKFFSSTDKGSNEKIEDVNELRFLEAGIPLKMIKVKSSGSLSVDVPRDAEKVISTIYERGLA